MRTGKIMRTNVAENIFIFSLFLFDIETIEHPRNVVSCDDGMYQKCIQKSNHDSYPASAQFLQNLVSVSN